MILTVSERTDIVAFYTPWFLERCKVGYVDVRNPFFKHKVSRIILDKEHVDGIIFCTKNPIPIMSHLQEIPFPFLFQITLTPYGKDIEPFVPSKGLLVKKIKELAQMIGKDKILIRYDPIVLTDTYTISYHIRMFTYLIEQLSSSVSRIIISFVDDKKNFQKNCQVSGMRAIQESEVYIVASAFGKVARQHHLPIQTCAENYNLTAYGFCTDSCISGNLVYKLTGKTKGFRKGNKRQHCQCIETVDIGAYNTCPHLCKYCYANYEERQVRVNYKRHIISSSLLIGELTPIDEIKIRK